MPTRRFVHAFTVCRDLLLCWVFHRAGGVGFQSFEIKRDPERFLTVVVAYSMMDDTELGFDPTVIRPAPGIGCRDEYCGSVITVSLPNGDQERIELHPTLLFHRPVIASRGTVCWKARRVGDVSWDLVVKDACRAKERSPEGDLLMWAAQCGVWGVAKYYSHEDVMIDGEVDCTRNITGAAVTTGGSPVWFLAWRQHDKTDDWAILQDSRAPSESIGEVVMVDQPSTNKRKANAGSGGPDGTKRLRHQSTVSQQYPQKPKNRIHWRTVVSRVGSALTSFRSISQLLAALHDASKGHRSLLTLAHTLHRDISINNIMIAKTAEPNTPRGFLIDLDLAISVGASPTFASGAPHRTGTREFMAIGVLLRHQHTYRHDVESFLHVFLWICVYYDGPSTLSKSPARALLATWSQHDFSFALVIKEAYMTPAGYQRLLDGFSEYFRAVPQVTLLAREWREIVFAEDVDCDVVYAKVLQVIAKAMEGLA